MKTWVFVTALAASTVLAATPAIAAKKKPKEAAAAQRATTAGQDPYMVHDGSEVLGRDPDPFIRLMIRREGRIRDQTGR